MSENTDPKCFFCGQVTDEEHLCHGCGEHICDDCTDVESDPWGAHDVDDHQAVPE